MTNSCGSRLGGPGLGGRGHGGTDRLRCAELWSAGEGLAALDAELAFREFEFGLLEREDLVYTFTVLV